MTALLVYYKPYRPCTPLSQPLPNTASTMEAPFWISIVPFPPFTIQHTSAVKLTPHVTGKGTQLLVGDYGQSHLTFTMTKLALFRQQITALVGRLPIMKYKWNLDVVSSMSKKKKGNQCFGYQCWDPRQKRMIEIDLCHKQYSRQYCISYMSDETQPAVTPDLRYCCPEFFSAFKGQANESTAMTKTNTAPDI